MTPRQPSPGTARKAGFGPTGCASRLSPDLVYFFHSFGFAAQYYRQDQELRPGATGTSAALLIDVPINGVCVKSTYLLTGGQWFDSAQAIDSISALDRRAAFNRPGAWEVAVPLSHLELASKVFVPGPGNLADPTKYGPAATESRIGLNWDWNKWARAQLEWEHAWLGSPLQADATPGSSSSVQDMLSTRFQFVF